MTLIHLVFFEFFTGAGTATTAATTQQVAPFIANAPTLMNR